MILIKLIFLPVRIVLWTIGLVFAIFFGTLRLVGLRRLFTLGVGAFIGMLLAPVPGTEMRERLRRKLEGAGPVSDDDLAERVRFELSHSPRTWHLDQPTVTVTAGRVSLSGTVEHEAGRDELAAQAAAVPGVVSVDNQLSVAPGAQASATGGSAASAMAADTDSVAGGGETDEDAADQPG